MPGTLGDANDRPPLVLISIDTLRSDRLPAYGFEGIDTPAIDGLRDDGILFERAYSHAPLTLPSHVSMFTGQLPSEHGVRDNQGYPVAATEDFLAQRLRRLGYATAGAVSSYVLHRQSGFASLGFDVYDDHLEVPAGQRTLGGIDRSGSRTLEAIRPWIEQQRARPFFLFFHIFEPHLPHTPPADLAARYGNTYEAEVAAADAVVGKLLDLLTRLGVYDRALILLLSDHGEGLGDHGEEEHGIFLYREALQVPMILKLPGNTRRGTRVTAPVQLVDVYPTLLRAAGGPAGTDDLSHGRALQLVGDDDPPRPIYAETYYPRLHYGWSELTSLILQQHHLIAGPAPELFDLLQDPQEKNNILPQQRRRAGTLRDLLVDLQRPLQAPQGIDETSRRRLEALGYLTTSSFDDADGPLPDPKAQLPSLQDLKRARHLATDGQVDEAVAVYQRLLADNPRLLDGWHALGDLLQRAGRFDQAVEAYGHALAISQGDPDFLAAVLANQIAAGHLQAARDGLAAARQLEAKDRLPLPQRHTLERQLATALARQGKTDEAMAWLEGEAHGEDIASQILRLRLLSDAGQGDEAERRLRQILSLHPASAAAHELHSLLALRRGAWSEAHDAAQRALELQAELAESWNNLGVAQWYLEQRPAAIESWQKAVTIDPAAWDTLYNLGSKAMTLERLDIARHSLQRFIAGAPPDAYEAQLRRARVLLRRLER